MFEAGALSKSLEKSRVCPILFGIEPTDLKGPLAQFQASKFQKNEVRRVIRTINTALEESALPNDVLDRVFDMWWPNLEEKVQKEIEKRNMPEGENVRSERDLLEEVLQLTRLQANASRRASSVNPGAINELLEAFEGLVQEAQEGGASRSTLSALDKMGEPLSYLVRRLPPSNYQKEFAVRLDQARYNLQDIAARNREEVEINEEDFEDIPF